MLGLTISFVCSIPELSDGLREINTSYNNLIILDDLMIEAKESLIAARCFTQGRHRNVSTVLLLQNMFPKGKYNTDMSRNAQYIMLYFEVQVIENKSAKLEKEFLTSTAIDLWLPTVRWPESPMPTILVDNKPDTPPDKQVLCDIHY